MDLEKNIAAPASAQKSPIPLAAFSRNDAVEALLLLLSRVIVFLTNAVAHDLGWLWFCPFQPVPDAFSGTKTLVEHCIKLADMGKYMPVDRSLLSPEFDARCRRLGELSGINPDYIVRIYYVAQQAKIPDFCSLYPLPWDSVIRRVHGELALGREASAGFLIFCGCYGAPQFILDRRMLPDGSCTLLPVAYFSDRRSPDRIFQLYEMPESETLPLLHSEAVRFSPDCTVEISSELAVAACSPAVGTQIAVGWYGGLKTWPQVDLSVLDGHRLIMRCCDLPDASPADRYRDTAALLARLSDHNRKVQVRMLDETTWETTPRNGSVSGSSARERLLTCAEFAEEAQQHGVICEGIVPKIHLKTYSMEDLLAIPATDFVIYPVIKEGYYCLIYGGSGVAKTWFALHLAIALTQGRSPFPHWECRSMPLNVLYVAGEMAPGTYGERLKMLLAEQKTNPRFRLIRENLDLTAEEDQMNVDKIICEQRSRVVFLDNLSTLATNGHQEGQFEKIRRFIELLTKRGIIVILVHHENREGGFKGSGKIELVADQSLHLFATGKGDKIELLVQAEKIRMTARSEQGAFRTEFDPKHPCAVWPVFPLTEEERRRLNEDDPLDEIGRNIGKKRNNRQLAWRFMTDDARAVAIIDDMLSGCPDDVIAANLVVREQALRTFKEEQGICEDSLKMHLEDAAREASREIGTDVPPTSDVLAPKIWALFKKERAKK